jgi:hypothetical protein
MRISDKRKYFSAFIQQKFCEMASDKAGSSGEKSFHCLDCMKIAHYGQTLDTLGL